MKVVINSCAAGATRQLIGKHVEVLRPSPNRRATEVRLPEGKAVWLPTRWLSEVHEEQR